MKELEAMAEDAFHDLFTDYFNMILGYAGEESENFWKVKIKTQLKKQFYEPLTGGEMSPDLSLLKSLNIRNFFTRLQVISSRKLTLTF